MFFFQITLVAGINLPIRKVALIKEGKAVTVASVPAGRNMTETAKKRGIRIQTSPKIIGTDRCMEEVRIGLEHLVMICEKLDIFTEMTNDLVEGTIQILRKTVDVVAGTNIAGADLTMMIDVKRTGRVAIDPKTGNGIT